ncbi:unnamed protein product [Brachionus calyciflorus]|uniref:TTF-type domain-containing protein n=1 Tax=Brachionus calyciflorus TaxID=104777 RepID=A0A813QXM8_9BILA|nr:unnamed protein product [Brachionus calyciflorus]
MKKYLIAKPTQPISSNLNSNKNFDSKTIKNTVDIKKDLRILPNSLEPYQPIVDFPVNSDNRKFLASWYKIFLWLEYEPDNDKAFCFTCKKFPSPDTNKTFLISGYNNWKNAIISFKKHENSRAHLLSFERWAIKKVANKSCIELLSEKKSKEMSDNRKNLIKIVESIIYLAKQGLAFRGHNEKNDSINKGNFREFIDFFATKDSSLSIFVNGSKNANYCSPTIQNELVGIIANEVRLKILSMIKSNKIFALVLDETSDITNVEQMSFCFRYVDNELNIHERFLTFCSAPTTDGESLFKIIKEALKNFGLNLSDIVGQCYDGAANMSGAYKGVASRMLNENKKALFVHCYAHKLNLALQDSCSSISEKPLIDFKTAKQLVNATLNHLEDSLSSDAFEDLWKKCSDLKKKFNISKPELCRKRAIKKRFKGAVNDTNQYKSVKSKFKAQHKELILKLIQCLDDRFSEDLKPISFIHDILFDFEKQFSLNLLTSNLIIYKDLIDFESLLSEIKVWQNFRKRPEMDLKLEECSIDKLQEIYLTIPISSASPERSFSCLKRIKSYLRNSMNQERLSDLALLNIEKEEINDTKVIGQVDDIGKPSTLQKDLDYLNEWSKKWLMEFNEEKCVVIHYGSSNQKCQYLLGSTETGHKLFESAKEKDLGVIQGIPVNSLEI